MKHKVLLLGLFLAFFQCKVFAQGSGNSDALNVSSGTTTINTTASTLTLTANAGQKTVKVRSSAGFDHDTLVLIIQMLGKNVGQWEVATINTKVGKTLTMYANLKNKYTSAAVNDSVQIIQIPQYTNVTISSGATLTAPAWNGSTGGILVFYSNGTITINGTISMDSLGYRGGSGVAGVDGPNPGGAGGGFQLTLCTDGNNGAATGGGASGIASCGCPGHRGGNGGIRYVQTGTSGNAGEGPAGGAGGTGTGAVGGDNSTACWTGNCSIIQMGSGGGGGKAGDVSIAGGGGGGGSGTTGIGGIANSGTQSFAGGNGGDGGNGGGIIMITANAVAGSGTVTANGGKGKNGTKGGKGGDGGSGGNGGTGGGGSGAGGQGANGSEGGGAGAYGAGGSVYISKISTTFSGTMTVTHGSQGLVGAGGNPGAVGGGGTSDGACSGTIAPSGGGGSNGTNGDIAVDPTGGGGGDITLPISLLSFNAIRQGDYVSLMWVTATEINNNYFTIEKSANAGEWVKVADVQGAGSSSTKKYYYFADTDPYSGIFYYRLKQVDYNGYFAYSNIVAVDFNSGNESFLNVLPTLSSGDFDVSVTGQRGKQVQIDLQNMVGQKFYSKKFIVDNDIFVQHLRLAGTLPTGIYMIIASCDGQAFSQKLMVK